MHPTEPIPPCDPFDEGLRARRRGKTRHDNPYSAGSAMRLEWDAGYCATVETMDDEGQIVSDDDLRPLTVP